MAKIYLTKEWLEKLQNELNHLNCKKTWNSWKT